MKIDKFTEQRIKAAARVEDVVADYVQLRQTGTELTGLCPFHNDHTPTNFKVSPAKQIYHCFACGAHGTAVDFIMKMENKKYLDALRWLAKRFGVYIGGEEHINIHPVNLPKQPQALPPFFLHRGLVINCMKEIANNSLHHWLHNLPWDDTQRARIDKVLRAYGVGQWYDGRVIFWQIDEQRRVRSGKLMRYDDNGHRIRTENPGWIHNQRGVREFIDRERTQFASTPFGMHLTAKHPQANINIVESEKTAIICAIAYGEPEKNLWLACGGLKFLKPDALQPLFEQKRTIILWPDRDGVHEWQQFARERINYPVKVNTQYLEQYWQPADGEKADVADIIIRLINEKRK